MRKTTRAALAALLLLAGACSESPAGPAPQFRGIYAVGPEHTVFFPCDRTQPDAWAIGAGLATVRDYWMRTDTAYAKPARVTWDYRPEPVYIEADGELLESVVPGRGFGHLEAYSRLLIVGRVSRVRPQSKAPADCR